LQDVWVAQSWSISVEIGLYLAAALAWRFAGKATVALAAAAAVVAILLLDNALIETAWDVMRGVAGFGLGLAAWSLWCRLEGVKIPRWLVIALELAALPAVLLAIAVGAPYVVADPLFAAVVMLFAFEIGPVSRLFRTAPLVMLGTLSYSLFMVHGFVYGRIFDALAFAQDYLGTRWVTSEIGGIPRPLLDPVPSTLLSLAMLAAALACAWPLWRFVEWPAREWSRRLARRMGVEREEAGAPTI
jgi:peptidoglycan/LPS O-acetylase OafA/YrhL